MNNDGSVLLNAVFDEFEKNGAQMFICARLAPTEEQHAVVYHDFMRPPAGSLIVDMGCGIGGLGHYLQIIDPTLRIVNVTNEPRLIERLKELTRYYVDASFESTGLPDGLADYVMFNESIGYGDLDALMAESARILKDGGKLIIKDFSPLRSSDEVVDYEAWDYRSKRPDIVLSAAYKQGLNAEVLWHPVTYMQHWNEFMCANTDMLEVWGKDKVLPLCQTMYKFTKGDLRGPCE